MEAVCLSSHCVLARSTGWAPWSEPATTLWATVDVPTTIYPSTMTETVTTATAAPIVLTVTTTSTLRVTLCEIRDVNPTYTAPLPIATDGTWGCPPGTICTPPQVNCNFERGLPSPGYHCSPDQCVPVPALLPLSFWGDPVTGDESPLTNDTLFFDISPGYFNMNPLAYDLSYDIFYQTTVYTYVTTVYPPSPTAGWRSKRQQQVYIPAVCYDECNDAMLEAQTMGKTPALCVAGSAFEVTTALCELCISVHRTNDTANFVEIQPQFEQFLDYCSVLAQQTTTTLSQATVVPEVTTIDVSETVTLSSSTYTFVIPTSTESTGVETIYPSSQSASSVSNTNSLTPAATFPTVSSGSLTPTSTFSAVPSGLPTVTTTFSTVHSGSPTVPPVTSTVTTLSAGTSSAGGSTTAVGIGPASTSQGSGAAGTTTPAAPSQFTGAAAKLILHTGASQLWIASWVAVVSAAGNFLFV